MQALRHGRFGVMLPQFRVLAALVPSGVLISAILESNPPASFVNQCFNEWFKFHIKHERRPHIVFSQFALTWTKSSSFESMWQAYCKFRKQCAPDCLVINQLASACRPAGQWSAVVALWQDVARFRIRPDVTMIRSFATAAAEGKLHDLALHLFRHCQAARIHDQVVSGQLIKAFVETDHVPLAIEATDWFCQSNNDPGRYNVLLSVLCRTGRIQEAFTHYEQLKHSSFVPNEYTFAAMLSACAQTRNLNLGRQLHAEYTASNRDSTTVSNALVHMYGKCGQVDEALKIFASTKQPNVVSYNALIAVYYEDMQAKGIKASESTYVTLLSACASQKNLALGQTLHAAYCASGLSSEMVCNSLIAMYGKCEYLEKAKQVFDSMAERSVIAWNALISAYVGNNQLETAADIYERMLESKFMADEFTYSILFHGCSAAGNLNLGRQLHHVYQQTSLRSVVVSTALIDMYGKCGHVEDAYQHYLHMLADKLVPDQFTYAALFAGCATANNLSLGRQLHHAYSQSSLHSARVDNALIDMYGKCGSAKEALQVFQSMPERSTVAYGAMINVLGLNGYAQEAVQLYQQMLDSCLAPDSTLFVVLLTACSHGGLVEPALQIYHAISGHNVTLTSEHVSCMADVLARAGRLQEAEDLVSKTLSLANEVTWKCILGACRIHGDVERAERIAERLIQANPTDAAPYILLMNIYTSVGEHAKAEAVRYRRDAAGAEVQMGISSTHINGVKTSFGPADFSHPLGPELRQKCLEIANQISSAGYQPDLSWATRLDTDKARRLSLCFHSERIAIAFNLLTTTAGSRIRITKNLRVCGDCHEATKLIARVYGRDISIRDRSRWHEFRTDGTCSCRDYF